MFYIYMIRCDDSSLYTGITTDVKRRFEEHREKQQKGAKYTRFHNAVKIEAVWMVKTRQEASKVEYRLKKLSKTKKEELVKTPLNICNFIEVDFEIKSISSAI